MISRCGLTSGAAVEVEGVVVATVARGVLWGLFVTSAVARLRLGGRQTILCQLSVIPLCSRRGESKPFQAGPESIRLI